MHKAKAIGDVELTNISRVFPWFCDIQHKSCSPGFSKPRVCSTHVLKFWAFFSVMFLQKGSYKERCTGFTYYKLFMSLSIQTALFADVLRPHKLPGIEYLEFSSMGSVGVERTASWHFKKMGRPIIVLSISVTLPPPCDMGTNNACVGGPFANYVYTIREGKNI